jgi:hypothetical protein
MRQMASAANQTAGPNPHNPPRRLGFVGRQPKGRLVIIIRSLILQRHVGREAAQEGRR